MLFLMMHQIQHQKPTITSIMKYENLMTEHNREPTQLKPFNSIKIENKFKFSGKNKSIQSVLLSKHMS